MSSSRICTYKVQFILKLVSVYFYAAYLPQIIELCQVKTNIKRKAHDIIDKFAERGLRSLAVAQQVSLYLLFSVV